MLDSTINALIIVPEITKGMKSIGSKALLKIKKNKCLLEYQIDCLRDIDHKININVVTGFESDKVELLLKSYKNINYVYDQRYKITNQAHALKIYLEKYSQINNLLIIPNGVIFKNKCINRSMLGANSKIFVLNKYKENFTLGCNTQNSVEYIFYDLPDTWSECVYLNSETIEWLRIFIKNHNIEQMYIFEIINAILDHKLNITKEVINKKDIIKIINQKDINKAKLFI